METEVKRGRGRPKGSKNKNHVEKEVKEKRPRGRPRKVVTDELPKKRGRPRKAESEPKRVTKNKADWTDLFSIPSAEFARTCRLGGVTTNYQLKDSGDKWLMIFSDSNYDNVVAVQRLWGATHRIYPNVVEGKMTIIVEKTQNS